MCSVDVIQRANFSLVFSHIGGISLNLRLELV